MERESNQLEAGPILCRNGCGFFGSSNTDGLCSKCYKDALKKKQQPPNSGVGSTVSAAPSSCGSTSSASVSIAPASALGSASPVAATAQPTVPALSQNISLVGLDSSESTNESSASTIIDTSVTLDTTTESSSPENEINKKKKNKCFTCKKKVGLTGFTCRCGGLYCSVHRYSNEHKCTFDYRELGAEEIRRNNPVVKGEKIQKI